MRCSNLPALLLALGALTGGQALASGLGLTSSGELDIGLFIPKATLWIQDTLVQLNKYGVLPAVGKLSMLLLFVFFIIAAFNAWVNRNVGGVVKQVLFSVAAAAFINDATTNTGVAGTIYQLPMKTWITAYDKTNALVGPAIEQGIVKSTQGLAVSMHNFVLNASMGVSAVSSTMLQSQTIFENAKANGTTGDAANQRIGDKAIEQLKDVAEAETKAMNNATGVFQIGYLVLLTFFMAYAGIIYLSAMTVVFGMLLLPLGLAFWANGNGKVLQVIAISAIGALLTVIMAPPIMLVASKTAMDQPTKYIKSLIDRENTDAKAVVQNYIKRAEQCAIDTKDDNILGYDISNFRAIGCDIQTNGVTLAADFGKTVLRIIFAMAIMIIVMMVALGVGAALIRQVPGLINSLFGSGMGGGHSGAPTASQALRSMQGTARTAGALGGGMTRAVGGAVKTGMALGAGAGGVAMAAAGAALTPRATTARAMGAVTNAAQTAGTTLSGAANTARSDFAAVRNAAGGAISGARNLGADMQAAGMKARNFNASEQAREAASSSQRARIQQNNAMAAQMGSPSLVQPVPPQYQARSTTAAQQFVEQRKNGVAPSSPGRAAAQQRSQQIRDDRTTHQAATRQRQDELREQREQSRAKKKSA